MKSKKKKIVKLVNSHSRKMKVDYFPGACGISSNDSRSLSRWCHSPPPISQVREQTQRGHSHKAMWLRSNAPQLWSRPKAHAFSHHHVPTNLSRVFIIHGRLGGCGGPGEIAQESWHSGVAAREAGKGRGGSNGCNEQSKYTECPSHWSRL